MMTKKMSLLLTGMLLCLAPDIKGNETDGRIKGIVMDGELGGPLEFVTVQVKAKGSDKILQGAVTGSDGNYSIGGLQYGEFAASFAQSTGGGEEGGIYSYLFLYRLRGNF